MMHWLVMMGLAIAGPAWGQPSALDCYEAQAARLDDRRSDARSVAAAVVATCHMERWTTARSSGAEAAELRRRLERSRTAEIDLATAFVLRGRR